MELDFKYILLKHGDGARYIFENACDKSFKKEFEKSFSVKCNPGDEGIDIFVGDFDKPLIVYQCKFFPESIGDSQKKQIRDSFKKAIESKEYELKEWNLCIPKVLDIEEHKWWATWKSKTTKTHKIEIHLLDSTALLGLLNITGPIATGKSSILELVNKAIAVPIPTPFDNSDIAIGIAVSALIYKGIPIIEAIGIANILPSPAYLAMVSPSGK